MSSEQARVVVITGASSGIGRATAHAFAERGNSLVLAARGEAALREVVAECERRGAAALAVPTDVGDEAQVEALAAAAVERFGRLDVWVGNASVFSYGTVEQTPSAVFREVLETNLLGQVYGARAALPHFRAQGSGVLVVVSSLYGKVTSPYLSPYITSKFGVYGFAEVLREELRRERGISVCTVLPATIDTPIYQRAANYTGRRVHPLPPAVDARRVAAAIVQVVDRPRRETVVGQVQRTAVALRSLAPALFETLVVPAFELLSLRRGPVAPTDGAVLAPRPGTEAVDGGWRLNLPGRGRAARR
jgi:short-subunit dehydrogenase